MSDEKKRIYQSETASVSLSAGLGMPPLQMVLVHHEKNPVGQAKAPSQARHRKEELDDETEEAVLRIIEHLEKSQ